MPKFLCSSSALLRQLKQVAHVVRRNPIVPVLANVLLAATGNELRIIGSDLENTVAVSLPIEGGNGETWMACCELKPLLDVLGNLPDQPITVEPGAKPHQVCIRAAAASSEHEGGEVGSASYTFAGENPLDYVKTPSVREEVQVVVPGHLLRTAFAYVADVVSNDMIRPGMMCVHVVADAQRVRFEATDGHRVAQFDALAAREPGYSFSSVDATPKSMLLPKQAIAALKALVKSEDVVTITTQSAWGHARFQIGTCGPEVTVRLVDEKYPDVDKVIPALFPGGVLTLSRPAAQSMLRRLRPFTGCLIKKVHLHLSGTGGYARASDEGEEIEAREPLPGTLLAGGVKEIAFNIDLLTQLIGLLPGPRVRMHFTEASKAAAFTSDGYEGLRYLLMPVMIKQYA